MITAYLAVNLGIGTLRALSVFSVLKDNNMTVVYQHVLAQKQHLSTHSKVNVLPVTLLIDGIIRKKYA